MANMAFSDLDQFVEVELTIGDIATIMNTIVIIMEITGDPDLFEIYEKLFFAASPYGSLEEDEDES
jgi:hypothetical protein